MKYVGVDGCRKGWCAVIFDRGAPCCRLYERFDLLWSEVSDAKVVMVDIPIGLPDSNRPVRTADTLARKFLGKRHSCVFTPSARETLNSSSYEEACRTNRKLVGKGISLQYWGIKRKVEEVDSFLRGNSIALKSVREGHPEVCFTAAAGRDMRFSKRRKEGIRERLTILRKYSSDISGMYKNTLAKYLRKDVAKDDIVDAAILALTARESRGKLTSLPAVPELDAANIPMAIWYHAF